MPVDWTFLQTVRAGKGALLSEAGREQLEDLAARAIDLDDGARAALWGEAIGYGLYSAAVVRAGPDCRHRFADRPARIAVKIYHNAATRFLHFHRHVMPGCAFDAVQRSVDAVEIADRSGNPRGVAILEYVPGDPLDGCEIPPAKLGAQLEGFFLRLLIPLWAAGHRFWDFRPANLIVSRDRSGIALIDTDCLRGSFERIAADRGEWTQRDEAEQLAFRRLPGCLAAFYPRHLKNGAQRTIKAELRHGQLLPALHGLGRTKAGTGCAISAATEFCDWASAQGI